MNDYIKRDDVIDLLEQVLNAEEFFDADNAKAQSDLALWFEERIAELPKADVVEWIPVSERLPEEDVDVLITYRYKKGEGDTSHSYIDITSYGDVYFGGHKIDGLKCWRGPFQYFDSNYEVVAWMPLPEPYREENEHE